MIKVEKDFDNVPSILQKKKREEAFNKNIDAKKFLYGKTLYKPSEVKLRLSKIYYNKCAYCEKNISDEPKNIEHYRPKDIYYWLGYSWDNLLFCCTRCNSTKNEKFQTENLKIVYNDEKYKDIHNLGAGYSALEKPMFINPEQEDILKDISFKLDGTIYSINHRVQYTIENCNLNRDALVQHRVAILNDFRNNLKLVLNDNEIRNEFIKSFISDCKVENEYFAFRRYVIDNIRLLF